MRSQQNISPSRVKQLARDCANACPLYDDVNWADPSVIEKYMWKLLNELRGEP